MQVQPSSAAPRIVSLLPGATEMVCGLGLGRCLVGRSHECDFPPEVQALPICSGPRLDPAGTSVAIDQEVRSLLRNGLSIFEVDADMLAAVRPDVILTQTQCEVCAVTPEDITSALADWTGQRPVLVSLEPARLVDVWQDIARIGEALGATQAAATLVDDLERRVARVRLRPPESTPRPTVAAIEWLSPLMAAGNWIPELIDMAGGRSLFGETGEHSPWLAWPDLAAADPDVIVVMPCGFALARTVAECESLAQDPAWTGLRAVREGRAFAVDGHQYFNRPGPRLADSLEILADLLDPTRVSARLATPSAARLSPP